MSCRTTWAWTGVMASSTWAWLTLSGRPWKRRTIQIFRRTDGVICKQFKGDLAGRMPQWLRFPMATRED